MGITYYDGDDDRDSLTPPEEPPCPNCGALWDEPCREPCTCEYCIRRRARDTALAAQKDVA